MDEYDAIEVNERNTLRIYIPTHGKIAGIGLIRHHLCSPSSSGDRSSIDKVSKLDPSNAIQLNLLYRCFSHNMLMIDFFLNYCVFPSDTKQFPKRMTANSWHVAENPRGTVVGFSGTNDNHRLLPLQVRQAEPDEPSLQGTNGKMLSLVLTHTKGYTTLSAPPEVSRHTSHCLLVASWTSPWSTLHLVTRGNLLVTALLTLAYPPTFMQGKPSWQALLDLAMGLTDVRSLLDCGAQLVGATNKWVQSSATPWIF